MVRLSLPPINVEIGLAKQCQDTGFTWRYIGVSVPFMTTEASSGCPT